MQSKAGPGFDWRDRAAYAPLLGADRSLFAWEWLRRSVRYRSAAESALSAGGDARRQDAAASEFGLVAFEPSHHSVPRARPLWRLQVHPQVLVVERGTVTRADDSFSLDRLSEFATLVTGEHSDHLLLSDGLRTIRLDGPRGTFRHGPAGLRYRVDGLASAEPLVLTLRRFLAICRTGRFARSLHPAEPRARRWILLLRAWDALEAGADQRRIAEELFSRTVHEPRWRSREPTVRSQAQRLVRSARGSAAGGFRVLLRGSQPS